VKPRENGALLLLSLMWGSAFLFTDIVVDEVPAFTVVGGRLLIAAIVLGGVLAATGRGMPARALWPWLILLAVTNQVAPFTLITWAQSHITSSLAATLNATMPIFTVMIAHTIATERPDLEKVAGIIVGFFGALILIGPGMGDVTSSDTLGQFAVLGGAALYAVSTVIARERLTGDAISLATVQMVAGVAIIWPLALAVDGTPTMDVSAAAGTSWVVLGIIPSAAAFIVFYWLIQRATATQVSVVSYLIPLVATVLGWAVRGDPVGLNLLLGLLLILVGMAIVNGNAAALLRRRKPPPPPGVMRA
jgi:drug/metabolite transporter (DMT)-like permease